jgi:alpha-galactosidase
MMLHFGAFITESSGHLSEYLPYYRKRKDLYPKYIRDKYDGGSRFYATEWPTWRREADEWRERLVKGEEPLPKMERSWEYASWIIEAAETNKPYRIYGNVMNTCPRSGKGPLIDNLPHDGCVEVACDIDAKRIHPIRYGKLPPQMAALCDSNMRMIELAAEAAMEKSMEKAIYALMLDPLTAACCAPVEIKAMALEMFAAEREFLPGFL